jgi:hypothetical protein
MRSQTLSSTPLKFLGIDVKRTHSTESTEDVHANNLKTPIKSISPAVKRTYTDHRSWRIKEMSSIFRAPPKVSPEHQEIPDMFSIKRCLAFDDEDEDDEGQDEESSHYLTH